MGRHLLNLARVVWIIVVMAGLAGSARGETMALCESDGLSALRVQGAHSAVEFCWSPDEPGEELDCGKPEAGRVLSTSLVLAPNPTLKAALNLGLCQVGIEVGFGNRWGADAGAQRRPRLGVVMIGGD